MKELFKLLEGFYNKNKSLVIASVVFQIIYSVLESIVVPFILAGAFNNIANSEKFKIQLIKLVCLWIVIKFIGCVSLHYHKEIDPQISKYIITTLIESVFNKYEKDNHITNVSVLIDKIHLIKSNLHDFAYMVCAVFIPRFIVMLISCVNFFIINKRLGITVFVCVFAQYFLITRELTTCVDTTYKEHEKKDNMYRYIEDLFANINTVQSTPNGYDFEMNNINNISEFVKKFEQKSNRCINNKQYFGYSLNIVIFSFILFTVYRLRKTNELTNENTTKVILLIMGLFDNMSEMSYYIPELSRKYAILKSNNTFLKDLLIKDIGDKLPFNDLNNYTIEFKNVSFQYPNTNSFVLQNFNMIIPENKIIGIYGKSGVGKTTFIKLIFGMQTPTTGDVYIGDRNIKDYKIRDIRKYISYIDQNTSNLFNKTVIENIMYGKEHDKLLSKERIKTTFERFGLYDIFKNLDKGKEKWSFLDQNVGKLGDKLSGGQKKIVHLLRIEMNDKTKIIILDEPSNGLDEKTKNNIISYIRYLNSMNKTIIIISHDDSFKNISSKVLQFSGNGNPLYIK